MRKRRFLILFLSVIILSSATVLSHRYFLLYRETQKKKTGWAELEKVLENNIRGFKSDAGIVVKDLKMDWEISFNKEKPFPAASLTKVPIMAACFLASEQHRVDLERNVVLKSADKLTGSGTLKNMPAGTVFKVEKLIGLMIYESDNTATNILTGLLGMDYLNSTFKAFGLKNTDLSRRIADYRSRNKGIENYTTAGDMAFLLEKMYRRTLINKDVSEKCLGMLSLQKVNDRIPKYLPVDITIAHKTGLERTVCHDVGIVYSAKGDFIVAVLTKHANPNSVPSKEFIAKIALHAYNYFEQL
jgi:beta-lactamase class A